MKRFRLKPLKKSVYLGCALVGGASAAFAQDPATMNKLEAENADLKRRLDALEQYMQKEGIMPSSGAATTHAVSALSEIKLSGFVTASYFYDTSNPPNQTPPGYLWNRTMNSFWLNKVKLTLESPEVDRDKWDAGYKVSFIFGQDAPIVDTVPITDSSGDTVATPIREAYVQLNVPIGTGLDVKFGQLISLLNFESGDGGAVNPNFSQGNQWYFTGNPPSTGLQLGYQFDEMFSAKVRVQNGMFTGSVDDDSFKTLMGSFGITPDKKTSINLIGFGGRESGASTAGDWLMGGSLIASRQLCEKYNVNVATEFDYFNQGRPVGAANWWSIGGWVWMDFTPKIGIAFRADYLSDPDGYATSNQLGFPANSGQDIYSLTFTVNWTPVPSLKIQPEIRYEHTTLQNGFGTQQDRVVLGAGASYLF